MRATWLVLALVIGATACTSFDSIDRGVCGNGLVEAGEDCDSSEASCVRCAVVCQTTADCPTDAYTCGTDHVCAAASGELGDAVVVGAFQVDDVAVTDLDRDGIGDVLGVSSTSLSIRFGDPSGRLERTQSLLTPAHSAPAAFGDLDGDGATDVAFSTSDGLVAYGSQFGGITPLASSKALLGDDGQPLDLRKIVQVSPRTFVGIVDGKATYGGVVIVFDIYSGFSFETPCRQPGMPLVPVTLDKFDLDTLDVYQATPTDTVLTLRVETPTPRQCMIALHLDTGPSDITMQTWSLFDVSPTVSPAEPKKMFLADLDLDLDKCPGIVSEKQGLGALTYLDGMMQGGHCVFATGGLTAFAAGIMVDDPDVHVVGRIPLDPGIGFVARDMLVLTNGVWLYADFGILGKGWGQIYASQRPLAGATSVDLDGDSMVDGLLFAADEDDIDVLYRRKNPANSNSPAYVVYRIDTTSKVSGWSVGDFDGNGDQDLAYIEHIDGYDRISVAYAHDDFLAPPTHVAAFKSLLGITALPAQSTDDFAGITDDLFVLQPAMPGAPSGALTILLGSTLGTMIPVIDPRDDDAMGVTLHDKDRTHLDSVLIGKFVASTPAALHDALVFAPNNNGAAHSPDVWRLVGTESGPSGSETPAITTTGFADCARAPTGGLCVSDARYLSWPTSGTDIVIGVDTAVPPHAVSFDPSAASLTTTNVSVLANAIADKAPVRSLARADIDGDGTDELIAVASGRGESSKPNAIVVCKMAGPTPMECTDIVPALITKLADTRPIETCVDAAPARVTFHDRVTEVATGVDLVVACREVATDSMESSVLYRVSADGGVTLLARTSSRLAAIHVGDVTGDGVDDILAIEGAEGVQSLVMFPQCSSRDLTCAGGRQ